MSSCIQLAFGMQLGKIVMENVLVKLVLVHGWSKVAYPMWFRQTQSCGTALAKFLSEGCSVSYSYSFPMTQYNLGPRQ
jgi:hypothetical protein